MSTLATLNNLDNSVESGEVQNNQGNDNFIVLLCCQTFFNLLSSKYCAFGLGFKTCDQRELAHSFK